MVTGIKQSGDYNFENFLKKNIFGLELVYDNLKLSRCDGIGRRARLKIL